MPNPFKDFTPDQVIAHNERVAENKRRLQLSMPKITLSQPTSPSLNITAIPPQKKALLNKTETLWKQELERRGHQKIYAQAITLRIGDDMTYRGDLATVSNGHLTIWETKSHHRFKNAGITKLKAAAAAYPWITFVLVMRNKSQWTEKEIGNE